MDKFALRSRKRSTDPVQEQLREHKSNWNIATTSLISQLIGLKRGINGRGDPKLSIPPGNIKDPLPTQIAGLLDQLSSEFNTLFSDAKSIMAEQEDYSQNRRQRQQERHPGQHDQPMPSLHASLSKNAEGRIGRLYNYLFHTDVSKQYRKALFKLVVSLYKDTFDFEDRVLSFGIDSIPAALTSFQSMKYELNNIEQVLNRLENLQGEKKVVSNEPVLELESNALSTQFLRKEFSAAVGIGMPKTDLRDLIISIKDYEDEINPEHKRIVMDNLMQQHKEVFNIAKRHVEKELGHSVDAKSIQELAKLNSASKLSKQSSLDNDMIIVADTGFTRWIKRNIHRLTPSGATSASKLDISNELRQCRKTLNELKSELKNEASIETIKSFVGKVKVCLNTLSIPMRVLNTIHQEREMIPKIDKGKISDQMLMRRLRRDFGRDF